MFWSPNKYVILQGKKKNISHPEIMEIFQPENKDLWMNIVTLKHINPIWCWSSHCSVVYGKTPNASADLNEFLKLLTCVSFFYVICEIIVQRKKEKQTKNSYLVLTSALPAAFIFDDPSTN